MKESECINQLRSEFDISESMARSTWIRASSEAEDRMMWAPDEYISTKSDIGGINSVIMIVAKEMLGKEE